MIAAVRRSGFLSDLFNAVFSATTHLIFRIPAALSIAAHLGAHSLERANARVNIGLLAVVWNEYNCNSKKVTASEELLLGGATGGGSGGGGMPYETCEYEDWHVSFDDGLTWATIYVWTCYIRST